MEPRVRLVQRHSHIFLLVHVVWATRDRLPMLQPTMDGWLGDVLRRKAYEAGCRLVAFGSGNDHVHVLVRYPSTICIANAVHRLKGGSSYAWNAALPRRPVHSRLCWQAGYWAESVSPRELLPITNYIETQRQHHPGAQRPEPWETALSLHDR